MKLLSVESWAAKLGYVVERYDSFFFVYKESEMSSTRFDSTDGVVEFILEGLNKTCCEDR